jgi:hypothetical protein
MYVSVVPLARLRRDFARFWPISAERGVARRCRIWRCISAVETSLSKEDEGGGSEVILEVIVPVVVGMVGLYRGCGRCWTRRLEIMKLR